MTDRAGSVPCPGACPTGHKQGAQGRPSDGHHIQPRVQIIRQVCRKKASLRLVRTSAHGLGPAELETKILSMSQGQGLMASNWAKMVLPSYGEAPGEHRTILCLHKATLSTESQAMYTEAFNLETGMKMPNIPVHSYAKD